MHERLAILKVSLCVSISAVQRRAIVKFFDAHRHDLDVTSLTYDLMSKDILTAEQCQKLASLDKEKKREALLYTLLAHNKVVECMRLTGTSLAAELQGTVCYYSIIN